MARRSLHEEMMASEERGQQGTSTVPNILDRETNLQYKQVDFWSLRMIEQANPDRFREWLQLGVLLLGIGGGLLAAIKAMVDLRENLRWKRANAAKDFLSEIHDHHLASQAVTMLDWYDSRHDYEIKDHGKLTISYKKVLSSLKKDQKQYLDEVDTFVRDCFDWFFYYIDRIEHYISIKLIRFEDVGPVFKPYVKLIERGKDKATFVKFMNGHEYELAVKFWQRYSSGRNQRAWRRMLSKLIGRG